MGSILISKKISPYAGLLGALLVFFSWITNSYLTEQAASDANKADAIASQEHQFENFRRIYNWQTNAGRSLSLLVQRGNKDNDTFKTEIQRRLYWATEQLGKLDAPNLEVQYLLLFIDSLARNSKGFDRGEQVSDKIQALESDFHEWFKKISELNKEHRDRLGGIVGAGINVDRVREDQVVEMEALAKDMVSRYEGLFNSGYLNFANDALKLSSELVITAESIAKKSSHHASMFSTLSLFFYFVGTIMIIYSKYQDIQGKQ